MKYLKMLGLAAVAAMAVMAFVGAGTASADELCTKNENPCATANKITTIHATLTAGKTAILETTEGTVLDTCTEGTIHAVVSTQGTGVDPITGTIDALTWGSGTTPCTFTTDTIKTGTLTATNSGTGTNGNVTGIGNEVTVNTGLFGSCVFTTGTGTKLGTITGGTNKLAINTVVTKVSGLCPSSARWTAEYTITNHTAVNVINN